MMVNQRGQTLIETLAAIFILTMGVTAAVGLANYALTSSSSVAKQIVATGLAREGIEAIKNMRDTNWLQGPLSDPTFNPPGCYNFVTNDTTGSCYQTWNTTPYCLDPNPGNSNNCSGGGAGLKTYRLTFNNSAIDSSYWQLVPTTNNNNNNFGLATSSIASMGTDGLYHVASGGNGILCQDDTPGISDFCRKIIISKVTDPPYDKSDGGTDDLIELKVQSIVWWKDGSHCTLAAQNCQVELDLYLTNWKNF